MELHDNGPVKKLAFETNKKVKQKSQTEIFPTEKVTIEQSKIK